MGKGSGSRGMVKEERKQGDGRRRWEGEVGRKTGKRTAGGGSGRRRGGGGDRRRKRDR